MAQPKSALQSSLRRSSARPSFGIELEFLVPFTRGTSLDTDPDHLFRQHGVIGDIGASSQDVHERLRKALQDAGIVTELSAESQRSNLLNDLEPFSRKRACWTVLYDGSVGEHRVEGYRQWANVELVSPARYATKEAFDEIRAVINIVRTIFQCRVNRSCGFHVHVGNGAEEIKPRALRKLAAFLWAADPLLYRLHAPYRATQEFSLSHRLNRGCFLADGYVKDTVEGLSFKEWYTGRDRGLGETMPPVPAEEAHRTARGRDSIGMEDELRFKGENALAVMSNMGWTNDGQSFRRPGDLTVDMPVVPGSGRGPIDGGPVDFRRAGGFPNLCPTRRYANAVHIGANASSHSVAESATTRPGRTRAVIMRPRAPYRQRDPKTRRDGKRTI